MATITRTDGFRAIQEKQILGDRSGVLTRTRKTVILREPRLAWGWQEGGCR